MRKFLGIGLFAGSLVAVACGTSSGGGPKTSRPTYPGGGAANSGGGDTYVPGGGVPQIIVTPPVTGGGSGPDNDPGNPNITHPKCAAGTCADFPTAPLMGTGVIANAPALFGDPTNFTAGGLCALEPQLSTPHDRRRDDAGQLGPPALSRDGSRRHRYLGNSPAF